MHTTAIDLLLVSGSRPQLLERTLDSFGKNLLSNFEVSTVYANIDPFEGTAEDTQSCADLIRERFPACHIRAPDTCSFTGAVKWLWSNTSAAAALHLEDDWVIDREVRPEDVFPHFDNMTRQIAFLTREKNWKGSSPFHYEWSRRPIAGLNIGRKYNYDRPIFTTSPSFLERSFAHECASKMRLDLDPEKQLYGDRNPELGQYTKTFRSRLLGVGGDFWISDIGREHRQASNLKKTLIDGHSHWIRDVHESET